jgi:7-cyano-7-deazaguanine synthase in queuosine biosynthesis
MASDACVFGHSWECYSGDVMNCIECDATGEVQVTYEPTEED